MKKILYTLIFFILFISTSVSQTPTLNCSGDIVVNNTSGQCGAIVNFSAPTCASNCSGTTIYQSDISGLSSGDFFTGGSHDIEYTITNGIDSSTCNFRVIVNDNEQPQVSFPNSLDGYLDNNCEFIVPYYPYEGIGTFSDNCDLDTVIQTPSAGTLITGIGTTVSFTLVSIDSTGNQKTTGFNLTISDSTAPVITNCPSTITEPITSGCQATLQNYIALVNVTDYCDNNPIITQSPASGTTFTTSQMVTIYAEDASGNIDSCVFTVVSDDITAPTITCPNDTIVGVDATCDFIIPDFSGLTTAVDNCDPNLSFSQNPLPGGKFSGYNTTQFVSMTVSDIAGNPSVCSFQVTLIDTLAPIFMNCKDTTLALDHNCELSMPNLFTYVGINENCSSVTSSQSPVVGATISGATTTTAFYTVTDVSGNTATCIMDIITVDTTRPNISTCPSDMTVNTSSSSCDYSVVDFSSNLFATDNCSSGLTITQSEAAGTLLAAGGTYPIVMSVSDDAGNINTCDFSITVVDNTPPVLNCPTNPSVGVDNNCQYTIPDYEALVGATDNCGNVTFTQTPAIGTILSGIGTQQSVSLFAQDDNGNPSSCSFTITLADTTRPTVNCPGTQAVTTSGNCQYQVPDLSSLVTFSDFCDASPSYAQSPVAGTTVTGIINVNVTITDISGNTVTCPVQTQPDDQVPPTITCPSDKASCSNVFTFNNAVATDDCGVVTISRTDVTGLNSGDSFPEGITTIEFTATDDVGNTSSCSFNIEVYPSPTISFTGTYAIEEGDSIQIISTVTNDSAFTWSPVYNMSSDTTLTPWVSPGVTVTYTLSVISEHGCTADGDITVTVEQIEDLTINNFLSPNDDGKNDFWTMSKPSLISGCNVSIYDRWGKLIWSSNAYNNQWDGTNTQGDQLPDGTYFYTISCEGDEPINGSILLMR